MNFKIVGDKALLQDLGWMIKNLNEDQLRAISRKGAHIIKLHIQQHAPQGPTGNLGRGVVVKEETRKTGAFVAMDYRIAPHAHLVEYGTVEREPLETEVLYDEKTGKFYGKEAAPMPKDPFFRRGTEAGKDQAMDEMVKAISKIFK